MNIHSDALNDIASLVLFMVYSRHTCNKPLCEPMMTKISASFNHNELKKSLPAIQIMVWISNYIHYKVWDEISYTFPNFNGAAVEVLRMDT